MNDHVRGSKTWFNNIVIRRISRLSNVPAKREKKFIITRFSEVVT